MIRISIVPDTNIFMSHLDIIGRLYEDEFPVDVSMSISKVVLAELDYNKTRSVGAREAIRFIEKVYNTSSTELEGRLREDRVEVVSDTHPVTEIKNNDDRILDFASKQVHPIVLTGDKAFYLKCKCHNVESILVHGTVSYEDLKLKILKAYTDIEPMDIDDTYGPTSDEEIKKRIRDKLLPTVLMIMEKAIGRPYVLFFPDDLRMVTLDFLLDLVIKENHLFHSYLPKKSKAILQDLRGRIKTAQREELLELGPKLLMLFRILY